MSKIVTRRFLFNPKGADAHCFVDTVIAISQNRRTIGIVRHISTMRLQSDNVSSLSDDPSSSAEQGNYLYNEGPGEGQ